MTKALITGGAGFIGSNVARLLVEQGYDVVALDNLSTGYRQNLNELTRVRLVEADVRDEATVHRAMDGVDVVFHLAASVGNTRSIENPLDDSDINVLGTLRILEAARRNRVRKIVCSSSAAIFGELKHLPIREDHPCEPDTPYGVSKLAEEKHCLAYAKLYELEAVCLRYFNVYGLNQRYDAYGNVIPIFAHLLLHGKSLTIYGDGEQTRDFTFVTDIVAANRAAGDRGTPGAVYNIGGGSRVTINHVLELVAGIAGRPLDIRREEAQKGDMRDTFADTSRARADLGFAPAATLASGLAAEYEWLAGGVRRGSDRGQTNV